MIFKVDFFKTEDMRYQKYFPNHFLPVWLVLCCLPGLLQAQAGGKVLVAVKATVAPLFTGMNHNAIMRIGVYVPAGKNFTAKKIGIITDLATARIVETIHVVARTDKESAFPENAVPAVSVTPVQGITSLAVDIPCTPGWNYFWISVTLKKDAPITGTIRLHAAWLTGSDGERYDFPKEQQPASYRVGVAVRKANDDQVHTYRIPGLQTTKKGTLIAVYDIRYNNTRDLPENIDVGMSRSIDGGRTWEPMKIIMDMGVPHENNGVGDPTILIDPATEKIWVAALWSKGNRSIAGSKPGLSPDTTGQFVLVSSDDDGQTWTAPVSITPQVKDPAWHLYFNGPGNGIAMQNGTLVFPSQYWDEKKIPHSAIVYSMDHGQSWKSGTGARSNTTESQVVETVPGTLMLNMRDNRGMFRSVATTKDMGKTWVEHQTSQRALPDPVCMASIIKASVKIKGVRRDVLFFSNVATQYGRHHTTIKASLDHGETWLPAHQLLIDERRSFGYSALTKIDDHTIGILYEGERDLYFLRIPVNQIIR